MVGESKFTFRATYFTRFTLSVSANGVSVRSVASNEAGRTVYDRTRDIAFSDIKSVTVYNWQSRHIEGEAVYLQTRHSGTVMFMTSPTWRADGAVSSNDRGTYFAATAAVFNALAAARSDLRVRHGRPTGWKIKTVALHAFAGAVLSGLFFLASGGATFGSVYAAPVVASILAILTLHGIYRLKPLSPTRHAAVAEVASWMAKRAPIVGPWGAATAP